MALEERKLFGEEHGLFRDSVRELVKREYAIGRALVDARVAAIYAGTTEIMKELVGRAMGF